MAKIIGVRFRNSGKVYYFNPGRYIIKAGSGVIVETVQGVEFGEVTIGTKEVSDPGDSRSAQGDNKGSLA